MALDPVKTTPPADLLGKTFTGSRNMWSELSLKYNGTEQITLKYLPVPELEAEGITTYSGLWNTEQWQVRRLYRALKPIRIEVLKDGVVVLETVIQSWIFGPRP